MLKCQNSRKLLINPQHFMYFWVKLTLKEFLVRIQTQSLLKSPNTCKKPQSYSILHITISGGQKLFIQPWKSFIFAIWNDYCNLLHNLAQQSIAHVRVKINSTVKFNWFYFRQVWNVLFGVFACCFGIMITLYSLVNTFKNNL